MYVCVLSLMQRLKCLEEGVKLLWCCGESCCEICLDVKLFWFVDSHGGRGGHGITDRSIEEEFVTDVYASGRVCT